MLEKIYFAAPYLIKCLAVTLRNALKARDRYGKLMKHYLKEFTQFDKLSSDERTDYINSNLHNLLDEASKYTKAFKGLKYEGLEDFPITEKDHFRQNVSDYFNSSRSNAAKNQTSGTSGSPMVTYYDKDSVAKGFALWEKYRLSIGVTKDSRSVRFSGKIVAHPQRRKAPYWVEDYLDKTLFMSTYHMAPSNLASYIQKLNTYKPAFMDGYPSSFYILAKYILDKKVKLAFQVDAISTTAETLYDEHREVIETAFNCKVYNQYASSEGIPFIAECKNQNLHVYEESGIFEFLNSKREIAQPGEYAELIATSFRSHRTMLIRYASGDVVKLPQHEISCDCGNKGRVISEIVGREDDLLFTKEKGWVGRMDTAYKGVSGIEKSQLIQEQVDRLVVNQIINADYNKAQEQLLIKNIKDRLGENIQIQINTLDDIPVGPNGKFDAVKRNFEI